MDAQWPSVELERINKGLGWKSPQLRVWEITSVLSPPSEAEEDQVTPPVADWKQVRAVILLGGHMSYTTQACIALEGNEGLRAERRDWQGGGVSQSRLCYSCTV